MNRSAWRSQAEPRARSGRRSHRRPHPSRPFEPLPPPAPSGGVTLIVASSYLPAFARFLDATAAGHRGICIVRESPDRLRAHVGPRPVEIYWLTNIGRGLTLRPNDLDAYSTFLEKAVELDRVTAFFLEGIEYLTRVHGTERVIERLAAFHVQAQAHDARVWVYLHPDLDHARRPRAVHGGLRRGRRIRLDLAEVAARAAMVGRERKGLGSMGTGRA